jgi:hypothetical protein
MTDPKEVERAVNDATRPHLRSERAHKELRLATKNGTYNTGLLSHKELMQARREIAIITLLEDILEAMK